MDPKQRREIDATLGVAGWVLDGPARTPEPGVPSWWQGEEEASDSFLAAMGVRL